MPYFQGFRHRWRKNMTQNMTQHDPIMSNKLDNKKEGPQGSAS
jgi:hypothetical protein